MKKPTKADAAPSQLITDRIAELGDWRGKLLTRLRKLVFEAAPNVTEEWQWGTPVWTSNGMVCSAAAFRDREAQLLQRGSAEGPEATLQRRP
jgi:hypothetical protein